MLTSGASKYDWVVRTGTAKEQLDHYYNYEGQYISDVTSASFTAPKNDYYRISPNQIDVMGKDANEKNILIQNPGY